MNRRTFLKQAGLAWMVCAGIRPAVAEPRKKTNVLVILADDLSHEAVHALGNSEVQTPNLDRLAARLHWQVRIHSPAQASLLLHPNASA